MPTLGSNMRTRISRSIRLTLFVALLAYSAYAQPQSRHWADAETHLTTQEFLELYFNTALHQHETADALNSFNVVSFYPGQSLEKAVLVIIQTLQDNGLSTDNPELRQEIRKVADGLLRDFTSRFGLPAVKRRWSIKDPKIALVIKHVRTHDLQDTLAVTFEGVTSFDREDFKRAERRVRNGGGVWVW